MKTLEDYPLHQWAVVPGNDEDRWAAASVLHQCARCKMYAYRDRHWKTRGSDRCGIQGLGERLPDGRLITLIDLRALEYGVGPNCERIPFADVTP